MTPREIIEICLDRQGTCSDVRPENVIKTLSAAGFVIVPRDPTDAMVERGCQANTIIFDDQRDDVLASDMCIEMWAEMIKTWEKANG